MMRIAIVNRHPSVALGGSETQCDLIARRLGARHDVLYVAPGGADGPDSPYAVAPVPERPEAILAEIHRHRSDVVYWRFGLRHLRAVGVALRRDAIPLVLASSHERDLIRGAVPPAAPGAGPLARVLHLRDLARALRDHRGLDEVAALVVNSMVHLELSDIRPRIHIGNGVAAPDRDFPWPRPYVAWVANLKPDKRPEVCIPLASGIEDLGIDVLMVGRAQVRAYEGFADRRDLPSNLHVLGPLPAASASAVLAGALLHVHTCRPEGFPNVFLQAWRAGVPSVSLEYDPSGVMAREGTGLVAGGDIDRLIAAVRELLRDPERRADLGAAAATYARTHADPDLAADRLERFLIEVTGGRTPPRAAA